MNSLRPFLLALLVLAASVPLLPAGEIALSFDRPEVGEPGTVVVRFEGHGNATSARVSVPPNQQAFIRIGEGTLGDGTYTAPVWVLASGEREFGPFGLHLREGNRPLATVTLDPVTLRIAEPGESAAVPADFSPPLAPPVNWVRLALFLGLAALLLAAAVALLAWLVRRMAARAVDAVPAAAPPLPPLEEARTGLAVLARLSVYRTHGCKSHYTRLSETLRRYIERQYSVPAMEMTEDEVMAYLHHKFSPSSAARDLKGLLAHSSMAKFARWEGTEEIAEADLSAAHAFLNAEEHRLRLEEDMRRRAAKGAPGGKEAA